MNTPNSNGIAGTHQEGQVYIASLPCPARMFADWHHEYGELLGCYNYGAKVELVRLIADNRAICKNLRLMSHSNHDGWTIVPLNFLLADEWHDLTDEN